MKPIVIKAKIRPTKAQAGELKGLVGKDMNGGVDVASRSYLPDHAQFRERVLSALREKGWDYSNRRTPYGNEDITLAGGSIMPHDDPGWGAVAILPLAFSGGYLGHPRIKELGIDADEEFSLVTKHGWVIGRTGDIIIFNADVWHAWVCNRCCAMYSLTVKRLRKRKTARP